MRVDAGAPVPADRGTVASAVTLNDLWRRWVDDKDESSRDALCLHYAGLVKRAASRIASQLPSHVDREELYSAGVVGLLEAVSRYDPDSAADFKTYATWRINGEIKDHIRQVAPVSRQVAGVLADLARAEETLTAQLGRVPTTAEVAEHAGVTREAQDEALRVRWRAWHASATEYEMEQAEAFDPTHALVDSLASRERVGAAVAALPAQQRAVVTLLYADELTAEQVGRLFDVSPSWVHRIRKAALATMRTFLADG